MKTQNYILKSTLIMFMLIAVSLISGMIGYRFIGHLDWYDSFLNATMILTGMGPVDELAHNTGKIFAGLYALYSGIIFLSAIAIFVYPILTSISKPFISKEQN